MNTNDIMRFAVGMAGLPGMPGDTRIYRPADSVRRILFGVDIAENDIASAREREFDLVIAHHPPNEEMILSVLPRHVELMIAAGVDKKRAESAYETLRDSLTKEYRNSSSKQTPEHLAEVAGTHNIGFMNIHLPCDELGRKTLQTVADFSGFDRPVSALVQAFSSIPEIAHAGEGVRLIRGSPTARTGKVKVIHAAGTNGGWPVAAALFESGVDTVVYIHMHGQQAGPSRAGRRGNLVITGHYGSDSIGINRLIEQLRRRRIEVQTCNRVVSASPAD